MTLPASFSLLHSEFNAFLFATVAEREDGTVMSVLSALTGSGVDPWAEAARLSRLPAGAAMQALAPMLVQPPGDHDALLLARESATRLIKLLPDQRSAIRTAPGGTGPARLRPGAMALLICLALSAGLLLWLSAPEGQPDGAGDASAPGYSTRSTRE